MKKKKSETRTVSSYLLTGLTTEVKKLFTAMREHASDPQNFKAIVELSKPSVATPSLLKTLLTMLQDMPSFCNAGAITKVERSGDKIVITGFEAAKARKFVHDFIVKLDEMKFPDNWEDKEKFLSGQLSLKVYTVSPGTYEYNTVV